MSIDRSVPGRTDQEDDLECGRGGDEDRLERLGSLLRAHRAVKDAEVRREGERLVAWVQPDPQNAPVLARVCDVRDRLSSQLSIFDIDDALPLAGVNRTEVEFLYAEIWKEDCYRLSADPGLPNAPVIVDVGANIGAFAVLAGLRYPRARVLAIEPVPLLCQAIRANAEIHALDIDIANLALSDADGSIELDFYPANTVMSGIATPGPATRDALRAYLNHQNPDIDEEETALLVEACLVSSVVPCRRERLTRLLEEHDIERVDLLKIDAEHSELAILRGIDEATWPKIARIVVEVHDVDERLAYVRRLLEEKGFVIAVVDNELDRTSCRMVFGGRTARDGTNSHPVSFASPLTACRLAAELETLCGGDERLGPERFRFASGRKLRELRAPAVLPGSVDRSRQSSGEAVALGGLGPVKRGERSR